MKDFIITALSIGTFVGFVYLCYTHKAFNFVIKLLLTLGIAVATAIIALVSEEYWVLIFSVAFGIPGIFILKIGPDDTDYTDPERYKERTTPKSKPTVNTYSSPDDKEHVKMVKHHILNHSSNLIYKFEENSSLTSCKVDLINALKKRLERFTDLHTVKMEDTEELALAILCDTAFNLLASGEYHIYAGELDPLGPGKSMYSVYVSAMNLAVKLGYNDEESKNETIKYLNQCISEVG